MASLVPYLPMEAIRAHARDFLRAHNPRGTTPVPIDLIVESSLGLEIIPMPGILDTRGINGYLSSDSKSIYVEERLFRVSETRYLFTLAHEIAHLWMHREYFPAFDGDQAWLTFRAELSQASLDTAEFQANTFAGLVLVPETVLPGIARESYEQLAARVLKVYGEFDFASDAFWYQVARHIGKTLKVNEVTARIRLQNDGFWGREL